MDSTDGQLLLITCLVGVAVPSMLDKVLALPFHSLWVMTIIPKGLCIISVLGVFCMLLLDIENRLFDANGICRNYIFFPGTLTLLLFQMCVSHSTYDGTLVKSK